MKSIHSGEYKRIIEKLKQARKASGLTQKEVASKLGKPQSFIAKVESGERRLDVLEMKKLAELYKKDVRNFLDQ